MKGIAVNYTCKWFDYIHLLPSDCRRCCCCDSFLPSLPLVPISEHVASVNVWSFPAISSLEAICLLPRCCLKPLEKPLNPNLKNKKLDDNILVKFTH